MKRCQSITDPSLIDKSLFKSVGSASQLTAQKKSAILNIVNNKSTERLSQLSKEDEYMADKGEDREQAKKTKYL